MEFYHSLFFVYTNDSLPEELLEAIEEQTFEDFLRLIVKSAARQIFEG